MEQNQPLESTTPVISIPQQAINNLLETGKWTKFLAILGFIFIGFMLLASVIMGVVTSVMGDAFPSLPFPGIFLALIYLVFAVLYFFPILYLFRFSTNIQKAMRANKPQDFNAAIGNLKSHYKFVGILVIIIMVAYLL
ncbi:MAG: DUF5362 family protein [Gillisia sp.]